MNPNWFIRIPFAAVFAGHGMGKLIMPAASAEMLSLPVVLVLLVGVAELLAGIGTIVGGVEKAPKRLLIDRLTGLAAAPVLIGAIANTRDAEAARERLRRMVDFSRDDPLQLNALINNVLFVGLVDDAVAIARDVIRRYPQHAFLLYQSHRVLLWAGHTEEAAELAVALRASGFPEENIKLVLMRQACAEGDVEQAQQLLDEAIGIYRHDPSVHYIGLQIMGRPVEAHQLLIDADLRNRELASFLNYPYFNHIYFPELTAILERQFIDRPFVDGPPYACQAESELVEEVSQ